jgi:hypothetical protein
LDLHGQLQGDYERAKWVGVRDTTGGWEGTEFNIGFEGSQALPVCPSGKCIQNFRPNAAC